MNVRVDVANDCEDCWVPDMKCIEQWLEPIFILAGVSTQCELSLQFMNQTRAAELNKQYRGKTAATNVLSFPTKLPDAVMAQLKRRPLGDIVVCPAVVAREASEQDKDLKAHWAHMLQHGLLHLLGFHHEDDASAKVMENLEINALQKLGLPNPYLIG